ncbi:sensor histidine kinase [Campylobacter gastrosuis]|uniref:histidine kinase n=1 Tax=Campylobacter gastrosuis TaxID=2974576 RepID=A0ABT7HRN7_9BACT|nr:HAMP domain-containing sensor histidine kinase [Campylobacter gastrosuis]MDL0089520.1 HAMP domain-containing histidine kinase [Campylobacter gastrosuis]
MSKYRHILPIFLLYFLTSTAFLGFFGYLFYERERGFLEQKEKMAVREIRHELQNRLKFNGFLTGADLGEFNATIVKSGSLERQNFSDIRHFVLFDKRRNLELLVSVKLGDFNAVLFELKVRILAVLALLLCLILLIAFFIIRLSIRPLYEKIELLNAFVRDTTHEINTPVSVILMSVEMFNLNPQKYLNNIKTAALTLSNLYDDLVAFSLLKNTQKSEILSPSDVVSERILYFEAMAKNKGLKITSEIENFSLNTNRIKFTKIVDNLLSNAIKYSDENGEILVRLGQNELVIKNGGSGIKRENLEAIFKPFTRFDDRNGGLGLGLSIVKKFCDELGFKISVKSDENLTEFSVKFNQNA